MGGEAGRQRHRNRPPTDAASGSPQAPTQPVPALATKPSGNRQRRAPRDAAAERSLRDLAGSGSSQLGVSAALRARDVNRPTEDDLAEAERNLILARRDWSPDNPGNPPPTATRRSH